MCIVFNISICKEIETRSICSRLHPFYGIIRLLYIWLIRPNLGLEKKNLIKILISDVGKQPSKKASISSFAKFETAITNSKNKITAFFLMPIDIIDSPGQNHLWENTRGGHLYFLAHMLSDGYRKLCFYALWSLKRNHPAYKNASCQPSKATYSARQLIK